MIVAFRTLVAVLGQPHHDKFAGVGVEPSSKLLQINDKRLIGLDEMQTFPYTRIVLVHESQIQKSDAVIQLLGDGKSLCFGLVRNPRADGAQ